MNPYLLIAIALSIALVVTAFVLPKCVRIARRLNIVDNPSARRLNKEPVPVLGGVAVFFGIFVSAMILSSIENCSELFIVFSVRLMMLYTGVTDDIMDIRPFAKFCVQILAMIILMSLGGLRLDNFHGLFGIYQLPDYISIPLTLFAGVGIINAINLIDGVDGLSSGYGIIASTLCGICFLSTRDMTFAILAFAFVGALIPFFIHNVFGRKYKMFIGDGGTLVLGTAFVVFIMRILQSPGIERFYPGIIAYLIAIFAVPVFDTLRVMTIRVVKKKSPFSPDKTHLHHLFIGLGFSHAETTLIVLTLNLSVLLMWAITGWSNVSEEIQLAIVIVMAVTVTTGIYSSVKFIQHKRPATYAKICKVISENRLRRQGIFIHIQRLLDR